MEKYQLNTTAKEPTVIYMERPLKAVSHTIHIEVPPNPFWASIGLSVTPLPLGTGVQYESKVSVGYLNQSFQNAVLDGIRYGLEQGVYGWKVTDCKICFEYGLYYSPVSTPADFRSLAPIVLEQVLKRRGRSYWNHIFLLHSMRRRNISPELIMTHQNIARVLKRPRLKTAR